MADKPLWRQAFDAVDRRVSGPAERAAGSDAFHDALALGLRLQARVRGRVERESRRALHLLNLPSNMACAIATGSYATSSCSPIPSTTSGRP
jgi:hypothetical protein